MKQSCLSLYHEKSGQTAQSALIKAGLLGRLQDASKKMGKSNWNVLVAVRSLAPADAD